MRAWSFILAAVVILASLFFAAVLATNGGDVSQLYSVSAYECARRNGWDFMIARGYCSFGGIDPNGLANVNNAKAAGIPYHDLYHFPCISKSAADQVRASYDQYRGYLAGGGSMLWFDIETNPSPGCQYRSQAENCQFIGELIDAANSLGIHSGVYSSPYEWESVAGAGCTAGASRGKQLWWADYNGEPGFEGFREMGGWTKPAIHQWADNGDMCGISFDKNYYP